MIFLHGFRGSHRGLMTTAERLPGVRVIIPDLPGYGESEPLRVPHDFQHYAGWIREFTQALNIKRYILAGHSYGASLALVAAGQLATSIERVVLVEPVISAKTWTSRIGEWYYRTATHLPPRPRQWWIVNRVANRITTELLTTLRDRAAKQQLVHDERENLRYAIPHVEIESFLGFYHTDFQNAAASVKNPTLVVAGTHDQMTPLPTIRQLQSAIPGSQLVVLTGAGHFAPMETPTDLAQSISIWLQDD